jgi:alkylation response protein AidB-like acyl-CoA dehydrogenase
MLASSGTLEGSFARLVDTMKLERRDGRRAIDDPVLRDRLLRLQARVVAARYHSLRMLTCSLRKEFPGAAGTSEGSAPLVTKLSGCELSHQIAALAIDAMGEFGVLYDGSKHLRAFGIWQFQYMFSLGLIIGGGTAQIQKNIISERGLAMPREPKTTKPASAVTRGAVAGGQG